MSDTQKVKEEYIMFLDGIGRLLMGKKQVDSCTDTTIPVRNPIIVHINAIKQPNGQDGMNIQFYPVMFREFQADKNDSTVWDYHRSNITPCQPVPLDARLIGQYEQIFAPIKNMMPIGGAPQGMPPQGVAGSEPVKVLKLFDE